MYNLFKIIGYLIFIYVVTGCTSSIKKPDVNAFDSDIYKNKKIEYTKLNLDSFQLDSFSTSFFGEININNGQLYFIDKKLGCLFKFDPEGRLISRYCGRDETESPPMKSIEFYTSLPDGGYLFIGPNLDCYVYDKNLNRQDDYMINWNCDPLKYTVNGQIDPSLACAYSLAYELTNIRADVRHAYLPIFSIKPGFNWTSDKYSSEARIMAGMDLKDGNITDIFGRLSSVYSKNKDTRTFSYFYFDLLPGDKMEVTYPPDSLIYICDRGFHVLEAFGRAGRDMNQNYKGIDRLDKIDQLVNQWKIESKNKGYYTDLEYVPSEHLTFREYQKGSQEATDGIQVYRSDTLIADLDVPKGFKVEGYIAPYFYSNAFINENKQKITVYKFTLQ